MRAGSDTRMKKETRKESGSRATRQLWGRMEERSNVCLGHQVLKNTHEIVRLGAAERPDSWRNITLLWLGINSSKRAAICRN